SFDRNFPAQSKSLTRGGPTMGTYGNYAVNAGARSNFASTTSWSLSSTFARGQLGGYQGSVNGSVAFRAGDRWELSWSPSYLRSISKRQYVTTLPEGRPETFGPRYIFSHIERSQLSAQFRVNFALSPDL